MRIQFFLRIDALGALAVAPFIGGSQIVPAQAFSGAIRPGWNGKCDRHLGFAGQRSVRGWNARPARGTLGGCREHLHQGGEPAWRPRRWSHLLEGVR